MSTMFNGSLNFLLSMGGRVFCRGYVSITKLCKIFNKHNSMKKNCGDSRQNNARVIVRILQAENE